MRWQTIAGTIGFGGMGALALASPRSLAATVDLGMETEMSENEVRAVYGGFGLAIAGSLLVEGVRNRPGAAHMMAAIALAGMASGRLFDVAVRKGEGELTRPLLYAAGESAFATALMSATREPATED